jgi:malate synthase
MSAALEVLSPQAGASAVLDRDALAFLAELQQRFEPRRQALLRERLAVQQRLDAGWLPEFPAETRSIRAGSWQVGEAPGDMQDRRVEITGPVDRKMVINALNSGASVFMADFEDANSPTFGNVLQGQQNLSDAIDGTISLQSGDKAYKLGERVATLVVRPRGWHLPEKHLNLDGRPMSGSLVDFGLYVLRNHERLARRGTGPYFYLPKLESWQEAALWNDVFDFTEATLALRHGTIKATVLIENILAAFQMEEILYALRDHVLGLNAGRWDYIFSIIRKFRGDSARVLPDRAQVTMQVPFMRAYTELLVRTCHRRGAHAIGGMAAFIPSRRDPEVNRTALAKVREDKERESRDGFDGTWVAHPDLVPVAREVFDAVLGEFPHQKHRLREDVSVRAEDLLAMRVPGGTISEEGVRLNVSVALQYLAAWLEGNGAVAINNLMEDAATAEIARAQIWQWRRHAARLIDGRTVDDELVQRFAAQAVTELRDWAGAGSLDTARALFEQVALAPEFEDFLTLPSYARLA